MKILAIMKQTHLIYLLLQRQSVHEARNVFPNINKAQLSSDKISNEKVSKWIYFFVLFNNRVNYENLIVKSQGFKR